MKHFKASRTYKTLLAYWLVSMVQTPTVAATKAAAIPAAPPQPEQFQLKVRFQTPVTGDHELQTEVTVGAPFIGKKRLSEGAYVAVTGLLQPLPNGTYSLLLTLIDWKSDTISTMGIRQLSLTPGKAYPWGAVLSLVHLYTVTILKSKDAVGPTAPYPTRPAELTPQQRELVDGLVARRITSLRESIATDNRLEANIKALSLRKKEWQSDLPARRVGRCAKECRDNHLPIPDVINEHVVDDIIWQYDKAYAKTEDDRKMPREECARALGFIGQPKAVPTICQSLQREGDSASWQALEGIADPRFIPVIEKYLDFTNQQDTRPALECLGRIGEPAIPLLQHLIEQKDLALRVGAATALIKIGTPACIAILQKAQQPEVVRLVNIEAGLWTAPHKCNNQLSTIEYHGGLRWPSRPDDNSAVSSKFR